MTDQDWKIITTLYSTSNITRTAGILYTTQPTISKRLQQMEQELGVRLVERNSKGVHFTPEGDFVAEEGRKILQKISTIRESVLKISNGHTGKIRLGITNSMGRYILPPLLNLYKKKYPRVDFEFSTGVTSEVSAMLENHHSHVGFIRGEADPGMDKHLLSVRLSWCQKTRSP